MPSSQHKRRRDDPAKDDHPLKVPLGFRDVLRGLLQVKGKPPPEGDDDKEKRPD